MERRIDCCRFCNIFDKIYNYEIDKPFACNEQFMAVASIGAMVEGWTLIIPQKHQLSMKLCYNEMAFKSLVNKIIPVMIEKYGSLIAFEHGSNKDGSLTSCGTNHAHLHLVPFYDQGTLLSSYRPRMKWDTSHSSEIAEKVKNNEYLFYYNLKTSIEWNNPQGQLHILKEPVSQFFRHFIAFYLGRSGESNYREFPFLKNAEKTRETLAYANALN